ncbi:2-oxoglutarate and iron-dependent oxygenase domain-containing protein [Streptomyces sp. NBC_01451]|uniref:2-oxoglutarate and iron-dependent oxygenase domain-containing protein n=1 Tax=Streptomyces sp. NBC_01451 TaxID=2903872 RepID=UPI002E320B3A|nr:2-oxoglutarate and iron-dependent oxygenase domain-containing protein [Streptomyces sp. NBC_01451]
MTEPQTFPLPPTVGGGDADRLLGRALIAASQVDGIFQIQATPDQDAATVRALDASRAFVGRPLKEKARYVSDLTHSGYAASGEEETAGEKDGSEIFTTLLSTPHKVRLADRERFTMAYFHEPSFRAVARPLDASGSDEFIHYGTHFTNMFMRCCPDRSTTARIEREDRLAVLEGLREEALNS